MIKTLFRFFEIITALSAIFILWSCSGVHKQIKSYPSISHLSVTSVVDLAGETMQQRGYRTSNEYANGIVFGIKQIGFRRFEMEVHIFSEGHSEKFLKVKCAVISNQVEKMSSLSEKGKSEVQQFHKLFSSLAMHSGLSTGEVRRTEPLHSPSSEHEPKGFE